MGQLQEGGGVGILVEFLEVHAEDERLRSHVGHRLLGIVRHVLRAWSVVRVAQPVVEDHCD